MCPALWRTGQNKNWAKSPVLCFSSVIGYCILLTAAVCLCIYLLLGLEYSTGVQAVSLYKPSFPYFQTYPQFRYCQKVIQVSRVVCHAGNWKFSSTSPALLGDFSLSLIIHLGERMVYAEVQGGGACVLVGISADKSVCSSGLCSPGPPLYSLNLCSSMRSFVVLRLWGLPESNEPCILERDLPF